MEVDRNGLEVLGREECLRLLGAATIGRIGVSTGALPTILPANARLDELGRLAIGTCGEPILLPVNEARDGETVVFRTEAGTELDNVGRWHPAFEADDLARVTRASWSVVVAGRLGERLRAAVPA